MKKYIFPTLLLSLLVFPTFVLAIESPVLPVAFYGQATINGANIPVGTKIRAYNSSGTRIDQGEITTTTAGLYGTDNIANANPAENRLLVVSSGTIYFKAIISGYNNGNEITAAQTETFVAGDVMRKDLTFTVCTITSVASGTVSAYPNCTITCNSGYTLSGNTCVLVETGDTTGGTGDTGVSLYVTPSSGNYNVGNLINISVKVNTKGETINTVKATLSFNENLEVQSISKTGSIFGLWIEEPAYDNSSRKITFGGGGAGTTYKGSAGKLISVTLKAKKAGEGTISFSSSSVKYGTTTINVESTTGGSYTINEGIGKKDMTGDGKIDFNDFATFALLYGKNYTSSDEKVQGTPISWGDYDGDGDVDFTDFAEFALSYGK